MYIVFDNLISYEKFIFSIGARYGVTRFRKRVGRKACMMPVISLVALPSISISICFHVLLRENTNSADHV